MCAILLWNEITAAATILFKNKMHCDHPIYWTIFIKSDEANLCIQHITPPSIKAEQIGENKQETEEKQNIFL
jgi:hypothetical protein